MTTLGIIILITAIIQEYICWMTYKKWFNNEITYCKMNDSYSILGMRFLLPLFVWIPIVPIVVIAIITKWKYLTVRWQF
jgi:hypothetical protein